MKKPYFSILSLIASLSLFLEGSSTRAQGKEYSYTADYASGCVMGLGTGFIGAGLTATKLQKGESITTTGYAASGLIGCLTGIAIVAVIGSQAEFNTAWKYDQDITNLKYELARANKERCLLTGRCTPASSAIIVESEDGTKKVGDKVITSTTFTLEPNE